MNSNHNRLHPIIPARQQGVALVTALVLLTVITMVGLASLCTTIVQNKATSNQRDRLGAFEATEYALRAADIVIYRPPSHSLPSGAKACSKAAGAICAANPFEDPDAESKNVDLAAHKPQYIIQYLGRFPVPNPSVRQLGNKKSYNAGSGVIKADYYRITARNGDPGKLKGRSRVVLQTTFRN